MASAKLYKYSEVDRPFPLDLTVCGSRAVQCSITESVGPQAAGARPHDGRHAQLAPPVKRGANTPLGPVLIGGRIRAQLTSMYREIAVQSTSPEIQAITDPADVGQWRWTVTASDDGTFDLQIAVTALKTDTDLPLAPTRYFDISIRVKNTPSHQAKSILTNTWTQVGGATGLLAAVGLVLSYLAYRVSKNNSAAAPTGGPKNARGDPTEPARRKRGRRKPR